MADDFLPGDPYHFTGPVLRRMTPEQLWDSPLPQAVDDLDERQGAISPTVRRRSARDAQALGRPGNAGRDP